jgi:hypothetical protein
MLTAGIASGSVNETLTTSQIACLSKERLYTIERGSRGVALSRFNEKNEKKWRVMMQVSPLIRNFAASYGLTQYGTLLFVCFTEDVIAQALEEFLRQKPSIDCEVRWLWARCRALSIEQGSKIDYKTMYDLMKAGGYEPGQSLYLSERDSQPRYDEPKTPQAGKPEPKYKQQSPMPPKYPAFKEHVIPEVTKKQEDVSGLTDRASYWLKNVTMSDELKQQILNNKQHDKGLMS